MRGARPPDLGWVSVGVLTPVVAVLRAEGLDVGQVLAVGNVRLEELQAPAHRVTRRAARLIWQNALHRVPDPSFGLRAARLTEAGDFDILLYLARSCATLGQALHLALRYATLIDETVTCSLDVGEDECLLSLGPRSAHYCPALSEYVLLRLVLIGRQLLGPDADPMEVRFAHSSPKDLDLHRKLFRAPLRFGCQEVALAIHPEMLGWRLPDPDPILQRVLQPYAQHLLERVAPRINTAQRVRDAVIELLPAGIPSRDTVARRLGVGSRTLARGLAAENTTYSAVVDDLRTDLAIRWLQDRKLAFGEIAYQLGFQDQSAFTKFFKRRLGTTPSDYRRGPLLAG